MSLGNVGKPVLATLRSKTSRFSGRRHIDKGIQQGAKPLRHSDPLLDLVRHHIHQGMLLPLLTSKSIPWARPVSSRPLTPVPRSRTGSRQRCDKKARRGLASAGRLPSAGLSARACTSRPGARAPQGQGSPVVVLHFHAWRSFPPRNCPRKKEPASSGKVVKCQPRWDTMRSATTRGTGRCTAKNQGRVHVSTPALQNPKGRFSTRTARATSHEEYVPTGFILHGSSDWVSNSIDSNTCSAGQEQFDPSVPRGCKLHFADEPWLDKQEGEVCRLHQGHPQDPVTAGRRGFSSGGWVRRLRTLKGWNPAASRPKHHR